MPPKLPSIMKVMDTLETLQTFPEDPAALAHSVRSVYVAQGLPLHEDMLQKAIAFHAAPSLTEADGRVHSSVPVAEGASQGVSLIEMAGAFGAIFILLSVVWLSFVCLKGQIKETQGHDAALTLMNVATFPDQLQVLYPGHPLTNFETDTDTRIAMREDAQGRVHTTWSQVSQSGCRAMVNAVSDSQVAKANPGLVVTVNGRLVSSSASPDRSFGVCQMNPEGTALIEITHDLKLKRGVPSPE